MARTTTPCAPLLSLIVDGRAFAVVRESRPDRMALFLSKARAAHPGAPMHWLNQSTREVTAA